MYNNKSQKNPINLIKVGNFTKNAVKNFEECIVSEHNFLEKIDTNLNNDTEK